MDMMDGLDSEIEIEEDLNRVKRMGDNTEDPRPRALNALN